MTRFLSSKNSERLSLHARIYIQRLSPHATNSTASVATSLEGAMWYTAHYQSETPVGVQVNIANVVYQSEPRSRVRTNTANVAASQSPEWRAWGPAPSAIIASFNSCLASIASYIYSLSEYRLASIPFNSCLASIASPIFPFIFPQPFFHAANSIHTLNQRTCYRPIS